MFDFVLSVKVAVLYLPRSYAKQPMPTSIAYSVPSSSRESLSQNDFQVILLQPKCKSSSALTPDIPTVNVSLWYPMHRLDELINTLGLAYSTIFFFIRTPFEDDPAPDGPGVEVRLPEPKPGNDEDVDPDPIT